MMEEPPKKVRKRPDVAKKKLENKGLSETVVKACLRKYLSTQRNDETVDLIREVVALYSQRMNIMSLRLSRLIRKCIEGGQSIPEGIFDQTFLSQLALGLEKSTKKIPEVKSYFEDGDNLSDIKKRHSGDTNIYCFGIQQYITNMKTMMEYTLEKRIKQYGAFIKDKLKLPTGSRGYILLKICGWKLPKELEKLETKLPTTVSEIIEQHRAVLGLEGDSKIDKKWYKTNHLTILRYNCYLNQVYQKQEGKLFNIVPICKVKPQFVTIDTLALYGLMKKELEMKVPTLNEFKKYKLKYWARFINFKKLEGGSNKFTGTIQTDGISLCVHFKRPKAARETVPAKSQNFKRVVACDTGRVNIMTLVERIGNKIKKYVLTRKQYYTEAGMIKARQQAERWNMGIKVSLEAISKVTNKGCSLDSLDKYIETYNAHYKTLWEEYLKPRWARQRMSLYSGKKRVFANFLNKVAGSDRPEDVLLVYGNANFAPGGKSELSVPTTRTFKECKARFPIMLVDEFRTSKICFFDDSVLKMVSKKDGKKKGLRGLLWSEKSKMFVDRDVNGAMNILRRAEGKEPKILRRSPENTRLVTQIGKFIK